MASKDGHGPCRMAHAAWDSPMGSHESDGLSPECLSGLSHWRPIGEDYLIL